MSSNQQQQKRKKDSEHKWSTEGGTEASGQASSANGSNVIAWLAQKATAAVPATGGSQQQTSKGALQFMKEQQEHIAAAGGDAAAGRRGGGAAGTLPVPRSKQAHGSSASSAPAQSGNAVQMLATAFPQQTVSSGSRGASPPPQYHADPTASAPSIADPAIAQAIVQSAPQPQANASRPTSYAAAAAQGAPPPPPSQGTSGPQGPMTRQERHAQRGGRRNGGAGNQQQQQADQNKRREAAEQQMLEQHKQAMESDPQYRAQYEEREQLQRSAFETQSDFAAQYQKQEQINPLAVKTGSLDIPFILDLIDQHQVTFICTDTGTGKSTSIPRALLELSPHTRIVSTQPRRTATVAIANRVAHLRREPVGEDVGYWIRGEKRGDEQTRLWYMTSYTLLLQLLSNPLNPPFTHILLDEFHERQPDVEVTVALLKLCLKHKTANFKLILMSATLNTDDWESYFDGLTVATYKQSEPDHPVHDYFMEDACRLLGMPYTAPPGLTQTFVDQTQLEMNIFIAQNLVTFLNSYSQPQHSILVFLPGRAQVEHFIFWLESALGGRVDAIPWHSAVDLSVIEAAIKRRGGNRQKVYVATDIAEVSITLPDVVFIVDLLLVKRPQILLAQPATIMFPPLVTQWVSKSSVAQRRGRVGRVQQGFYFCLLSQGLIPQLSDHSTPPVEHSRIDELSLHCLQIATNPAAVFSICRGQPLYQTIVSAMATLSHLGCIVSKDDVLAPKERIDEMSPLLEWSPLILQETKALLGGADATIHEYQLTFIGRLLQLMPVSVQQGMLIFYGFLTGLESLMVLAAAVTSSLSPFSINPQEHQQEGAAGGAGNNNRRRRTNYESVAKTMEQTETVMKDMNHNLRSDIVAIMGAVIQFKLKRQQFANEPESIVRQWARQLHLSFEKLQSVVELEAHIKFELAAFIPFRDIDDPAVLAQQLERLAPMVLIMTNAAFASQALEVTSEGNAYAATKEGAVGLFTDLKAVPDLHSPSCLRWEQGDIIVPVTISLHFSRMLVSFSNAIKSHKQFWLSVLLFAHRLQYATFSDDQGMYTVFRTVYCGRRKYLEVDSATGFSIVQFRERLCNICAAMRLQHLHRDDTHTQVEFDALLRSHGLNPMEGQQREVLQVLAKDFFSQEAFDAVDVVEVEHDDDDLDHDSILSFAIPPVHVSE